MAFLFDWAFLGSSSGTTTINDGGNVTNFTSTSIGTPGTNYSAGFGGTLQTSGVQPGQFSGVQLDFTTAVKDLSFEIIDLDAAAGAWDDQVSIFGFDVDGNQVPITFSNLEAYHSQTGPNTVEANGNSSTGYDGPGSPDSITVTIDQPVVRVFVVFQGGSSGLPTATIGMGDLTGSVVCFAAGTRIRTQDGNMQVERLKVGDVVKTLDNGCQKVRWVGCRKLCASDLETNENLRPIRIKSGSLADGLPSRDLIVSPQHRILIRSKIANRMFDEEEVFVRAKHLVDLPGVSIDEDMQSVTYVHIMCDDHEIVEAEGVLAETLYTGPEAMKAMTPAAKQEIEQIFGEVPYLDRPLVRIAPKGRLARKLVARHVKNDKSIYAHV